MCKKVQIVYIKKVYLLLNNMKLNLSKWMNKLYRENQSVQDVTASYFCFHQFSTLNILLQTPFYYYWFHIRGNHRTKRNFLHIPKLEGEFNFILIQFHLAGLTHFLYTDNRVIQNASLMIWQKFCFFGSSKLV